MRPVFLEFSGLQSYREAQSIDFTRLLAGGLFGIFGPTGSGKSTILDAITLALYGEVERAERRTHGILNHAENRLYVKFVFALRDAAGERVYRVERSYVRDGDATIKPAHCRLVETVAGDEKVLADKDRDITSKIEQILGLKADDFTRAVVLPQGRFAEFLHLQGKDRRDMLERIFSLGRYGVRLQTRVKKRLDQVAADLRAVESAQAELGDVSEKALRSAEERLAAANLQVQEAEKAASAAEEEFQTAQKIWELSQDLAKLETAYEEWLVQRDQADTRRQELALAERAEPVRHLLESAQTARDDATKAAEAYEAAVSAAEAAKAAETEAFNAYKEASQRKDAETPRLLERRVQLQQARERETEVAQYATRAEKLAREVSELEQKKADSAERVRQGEERLRDIEAERTGLLGRLASTQVPPEKRKLVNDALLALDRLSQAERATLEAQNRLTQREQQLRAATDAAENTAAAHEIAKKTLAELSQSLAQLESTPPATEEELSDKEARLVRIEGAIKNVDAAEKRLAQAQDELKRAESDLARLAGELEAATAGEGAQRKAAEAARAAADKARADLEAARQAEQAAALAVTLAPGVPCPVCGSLEHPHPAQLHPESSIPALEAALGAAEKAWQDAERAWKEAERRLAAAQEKANSARDRLSAAETATRQAAGELDAARAELPEAWRSLPVTELSAAWAGTSRAQAANRQAYQQWRENVDRLRRARDDQVQRVAGLASVASAAGATLQAAKTAHTEAVAAAADAAAKLQACRHEFDKVRGGYDAAALDEQRRLIEEADREQARLNEELAALQEREDQVRQQLAAARNADQEYTTQLARSEAEHAQVQQAWQKAAEELRALAGGRPVAPQLAEVEELLRQLEAQEAATAEARAQAEKARQRAEAHLAAAQKEKDLAIQRVTSAEKALADGLAQSGFGDAEAAAAALRSRDRREELQNWLRGYDQEGHHLGRSIADRKKQLAGRRLDDEGWAAVQARREQARQVLEQRRDERASAVRDIEDLRNRRARWEELEQQRASLATQKSHLDELQRALAGNAFVDYLAGEEMAGVAQAASERLGQLSRYRYALEVDSGGGFVIRDDGNGGVRRPVTTLSGGETFLASLALALALSAQVQLRGHYPLEFFFLDEGFGTLDPELLDLVITTLERLHFEKLHVGVITHVPELRHRVQRRVIVEPAEPGGRGSRIHLEFA